MEYQPVVLQGRRTKTTKHNAESRYWRTFKHPVFVKEYAPVTAIHFSPSKPHRYVVTSATRVQIYNPRTQKVTKTISRFKDVARSGNIRSDGKLIVAGDDTGLVQIFDINSRAILRTLDEHKQPVHVSKFSPSMPTQVLTCSDDTTAKLWDVPSQSVLTTFSSHSDYIRSGQVSPASPHLVLTGSYDSTLRLHDSRTGECEMAMGVSDGSSAIPVEQVVMFPSGSAAISSGGPIVRVWDLIAGGRCLSAFSNHQKTITSLVLSNTSDRLLTGSLDQMVKVYDVSNYRVVHTIRYPAPLLSLAISPDEIYFAAGMTDGTFSVRQRQPKASENKTDDVLSVSLRPDTYESFLGTVSHPIEKGGRLNRTHLRTGDVDEFRIERKRAKRLKDYDKLLKGFKYSAALDAVLRKQIPPATTFSVIQELVHRDGLRAALAGRDDVLLEPVLRFLLKHICDPRFGITICSVARLVIDMYSPILGQSPLIDSLFLRLHKKVLSELRFQYQLVKTKGALDMILAASILAKT